MLLYRNAPSIGSIGGWDGFSFVQICARLTNQSELFWDAHAYECEDIVKSRLRSFATTAQILVYFIFIFRLLNFVISLFLRAFDRCVGNKKTLAMRPPKHDVVIYLPHSSNFATWLQDNTKRFHVLECDEEKRNGVLE